MKLNKDQQLAVTHIYETGETYLVGQMGSGKTAVALTAAGELLRAGEVKRVLVVAPLKVCQQVWPVEASKWGGGLSVSVCTGTGNERLNAIAKTSDILCVNFENLKWLLLCNHGCDMLIVDEVSKMKAGGVQFKTLRKYLYKFVVRLVMSGTPVSEDWLGLFYPMMIVSSDCFGKNKAKFKSRYFHAIDYMEYNWELRAGQDKHISARVKPYMVILPDYVDELPLLTIQHELVTVPMDTYTALKRDMLIDGVTANNAAVLTGKLQQCACGFLYADDGGVMRVHRRKQEWFERSNIGPTVIVYQYQEELRRLEKMFSDHATIDTFKQGDKILLIHPKSAGHGLDLTEFSNMVFMSPVWSRDLFRQTIARIWRRGQTEPCLVTVLVGRDTIEQEIVDRERAKGAHHKLLMSHLQKNPDWI